MLLTAKNNSRGFLKISNFTLQHKSNTDSEWKNVKLCGPDSDVEVPVSNGSRCCWTTQQGSLPMKDELKLSCEYKTDDFSDQAIPWRSVSSYLQITFKKFSFGLRDQMRFST